MAYVYHHAKNVGSNLRGGCMTEQAIVKNGIVVAMPKDKNTYVTCDKCGRKFIAKYIYCVCKG